MTKEMVAAAIARTLINCERGMTFYNSFEVPNKVALNYLIDAAADLEEAIAYITEECNEEDEMMMKYQDQVDQLILGLFNSPNEK